jgi:predicted ATPase
MHLLRLKVRNVRSISELELKFDPKHAAGWHVLLGDNGAGKSTIIRSIALALVGPKEAAALRQVWAKWLNHDAPEAQIEASIHADTKFDTWTGKGNTSTKDIVFGLNFTRLDETREQEVELSAPPKSLALRTVWGGGSGWFSASFGPFRRFSGGDKEYDRFYSSNPRLAPHLSAFGEDVALTESLRWLQELHIGKLEGSLSQESVTLDSVKNFLNKSKLLPHGATIGDINSKRVVVVDGNKREISIENMSDGYRSILSMTFEIIRQMFKVYGADLVIKKMDSGVGTISLPGVVVIDEVDAHLHPAWQKSIGEWFVTRFPQIQFIVSTHSPIICRAVGKTGSIWRLPSPGTSQSAFKVEGSERARLVYGDLLDAYSTEYFGANITRSQASQVYLEELAKLNLKNARGRTNEAENKRIRELRSMLPTSAPVLPSTDRGTVNAKTKR